MEELSIVNKKGGTELTEITTKVEIADRTGHTTLQLTQRETLERVSGLVPGCSQETEWSSQMSWLRLIGKLLEQLG